MRLVQHRRSRVVPAAVAGLAVALSAAVALGAEVPSSPRSRAAIEKSRPALEQALTKKGLALGAPVFLRIFKESSELEVWVWSKTSRRFELFRTYPICHFSGTLGPKQNEGDSQAPEGFYRVAAGQMNPSSRFHLSFNLGYPNAYDRAWKRTGGALMIHGSCVSIGCFAMTNPVIEEIWTLAETALRSAQGAFEVHIFPFRLQAEHLEQSRRSPWFEFWSNLKEGYDRFEATHLPPQVRVKSQRYVFEAPFTPR